MTLVTGFLFLPGYRPLSDFFDKWPKSLKIFRTILHRNVWEIIVIVIVEVIKLEECPVLSGGQQEHCSYSLYIP